MHHANFSACAISENIEKAEKHVTKGTELYDNAQYENALKEYLQAIDYDHTNIEYYHRAYWSYRCLHQKKQALDILLKAPEPASEDEFYPEHLYLIGVAYGGVLDHKRADSFYQKIINLPPPHKKSASFWLAKGKSHCNLHDNKSSLACFIESKNSIDKNTPNRLKGTIYFYLGHVSIQLKKYNEAIEHLEACVTYRPNAAQVLDSLGTAYRKKGELEKAAHYYTIALQKDPKLVNALAGMGRYFHAQDNLEKAKKYFLQALKNNPKHIQSHMQLTRVYIDEGNKDKALDQLQQVQALNLSNEHLQKRIEKYQVAAVKL
jgi:tetratricopeptide (TPR) repeat protein